MSKLSEKDNKSKQIKNMKITTWLAVLSGILYPLKASRFEDSEEDSDYENFRRSQMRYRIYKEKRR